MKKLLVCSFLVSGTILFTACNGSNQQTDSKEVAKESNEKKFDDTSVEDDAKFVVAAADGGMMEVKLGQLALTNAAAASVKEFGQMMVDDHGKANTELKTLAGSKNITIPDMLSKKNLDKYDELAKKTGADFDKAYTDFMVDDHKEDIDEFKKEGDKGKDAEIKAWAAGKVATLEHHLQMAQTAKDAVKK